MKLLSNSRTRTAIAAFVGVILSFDAAYAASGWVVGLTSGTPGGEAKAASVQNISIAAVASQAFGSVLYPGGEGDVELSITNPNPFPVTVTAVALPAATVYAAGYTDAGLTVANLGCTALTSSVAWTPSTDSGSLSAPVIVAANNTAMPLVVTLTGAATMGSASPSGCSGTYFSMPSLTGVTATGGAATPTAGPVTDYYGHS